MESDCRDAWTSRGYDDYWTRNKKEEKRTKRILRFFPLSRFWHRFALRVTTQPLSDPAEEHLQRTKSASSKKRACVSNLKDRYAARRAAPHQWRRKE
jgi:hypothetical protein